MQPLIRNATVVLRTVGERTTNLCLDLIQQQIIEKNIFIINEVPFSKAVSRTFEIGLENDLPWTIAIDADVLLKKNGLRSLIAEAEQTPFAFFKGNAKAHDKFLGWARYLPPHIYSTKFLAKALDSMPQNFGLRPETEVTKIISEKYGLKQAYFSKVIAIHDFEQYYTDIYRKSYVFGNKHLQRINHYINYWSSKLKKDKDFLVALVGLFKGLYSEKEIQIDIRKLPLNYKEVFILSDLNEKQDLTLNSKISSIEGIIWRGLLNKFIKDYKKKIFIKLNIN